MVTFDIDHDHAQVSHSGSPRRRQASEASARILRSTPLYVSYGGDGGGNGNGSLLRYDLVESRVVWDHHYDHGIDSMAASSDGTRLYMPDGELSAAGLWFVISAETGDEIGVIHGGAGAHNTVVGRSGSKVYLGGRDHDELEVFDVAAGRVTGRVGPLKEGVRPFTVNGRETLAFTTATGFLGFQVGSLETGRVLYTNTFAGYTWDPKHFGASAPSHGISLSPDERELYVLDGPNSVVHVFDVSKLPGSPPAPVADIHLTHPLVGQESPCAYDCLRDGWLQHSRDGRFVYVGDSGDVIDTTAKKPSAYLPALANSRKSIEIDWRDGIPVSTTTRHGLGYVDAPVVP